MFHGYNALYTLLSQYILTRECFYFVYLLSYKNVGKKQANKQTNKQTNKQATKPANKHKTTTME